MSDNPAPAPGGTTYLSLDNPQGTRIPLSDGTVAVFPPGTSDEEMKRAIQGLNPPPDNSGFLGPIARPAGDLASGLSAAYQGTTPHVQKLTGEMNYKPLGEFGPLDSGGTGFMDPTGMHQFDPAQHVVLNDPASGKPMVYQRSPETNENVFSSLGRLLGFGSIASSNLPIAAPARGAATILGNRFGGPETAAQNAVGGAMRSDIAAGGPAPVDIARAMTEAPTSVLPVDVAGENVRGLAGQAARVPGPGRQQIASVLNDRDALAGRVLTEAVDTMGTGGAGQSTFLAGRALETQARADATPLYGRAYMYKTLNPDHLAPGGELSELLKRDSMSTAARNAQRIVREQGGDPASLGIGFNEAGDVVFEGVPSWRTLDYMKRGLDDVVSKARNSITGRLDTEGNAINDTRKQFLAFLDKQNPDYAPARAAWGGPQASRDALEEGAQIFGKSPDQIATELAELSPADRKFYQLGAANSLKTDLAATSSGGDEARKLIGNVNRQDQLRAAFPDTAEQMINVANTEKLKFGTRQELLGGSQTAPRLAQDATGSGGIVGPLVEGGMSLATGGMAGRTVLDTVKTLAARLTGGGMSPRVANAIAGQLLQSDPVLARAWLMQAFERGQSGVTKPIF